MPFTYNLPLPEIPPEALEDSGGVRLARFLVEEGSWMQAGTAVAELESATAVIRVLANGTGVLRKRVAAPGATLRAGDVLAVVEADGEAVPYDRPYSLADLSLVGE
jgi:pyruvate/2-oxoglutarate dehydrogenase complex dihydrolipoamide acyltransferase (E2) component